MRGPRVSVPITLTSALVAISLTLTIGWEILVAREFRALMDGFTFIHWFLVVVGALFFAGIIAASILQTVWLVREIRTGQRQRSFIDAVTHELHPPLATLRLYLDTLESATADEAQKAEFLGIMGQELDRLERTVGHLLHAARSEEGTRPWTEIDLLSLLEECADDLRERHGLDDKAVRVHPHPGPAVRIRGEREALRLAFRSLLENAVHYAADEVRVDVNLRTPSRRWVEVEVADQGVGLPASEWERIFERFPRLAPAGLLPGRGLGLGLHLVRSIVRLHKGSVHAESDGVGTGSRFVVKLRRVKVV